MYAIISEGGRQLKVEEGQELDIDYRDVAGGRSGEVRPRAGVPKRRRS